MAESIQEDAFQQLREADLVHLDPDGQVTVAYPFSGRPTGHAVQMNGTPVVSAMCAIDALGIPLMTGRDAVIVAADPSDGHPIRIDRRGDIWRWAPEDTAVLGAQTSRCGPAASSLCPTTTFHTSRHRAEDYLRRRAELTGRVLNQGQALDIARRSFGSLLEPDTRMAPPQPPVPTTRPPVTVEMLYTEDCPHAADYLPHLRQLLVGAGVTDAVRVRVITDSDQAQRERFLGSPTIRVNGRDVDPTADQRRDYGLSCRLYPSLDGMRGTPPDKWIRALLRRIRSTTPTALSD